MATTIGNLVIEMSANVARLQTDMAAARQHVTTATGQIQSAANMARNALQMIGVGLSVSAFAGFIRNAADAQEQLVKLSQKTGTTVEQLAALSFAANMSDVSMESVAGAAKKLAVNMNENPEVFRRFGITATDTTGALVQLAGIFERMPDGVQKAALAVQLMGKNGEEMIPFLNNGEKGMAELIERGKEYSAVTDESARSAEQFNDNLKELQIVSGKAGQEIVNELVPAMNAILAAMIAAKRESGFLTTLGVGIGGVVDEVFKDSRAERIASLKREIQGIEQYINKPSMLTALADIVGEEPFEKAGKKLALLRSELAALEAASKPRFNLAAHYHSDWSKDGAQGKAMLGALGGKKGSAVGEEGADPRNWLWKANATWEREREKQAADAAAMGPDTKSFEAIMAREAENEARRREQESRFLAERMDEMAFNNLTEIEQLTLQQDQKLDILRQARAREMIDEGQYQSMRQRLELEHQAKVGNAAAQGSLARMNFEKMTTQQKRDYLLNDIMQTTQAVATHSRAMFNINKAAAIATAVVEGIKGAEKTWNEYPYPWNIPMTALHIASSAARISQLKSTEFGSSSSAPSIGGGSAIPTYSAPSMATQAPAPITVAEKAAPQRTVNLYLREGSVFDARLIRDQLIPALNDAIGDGVTLNVRPA